MAPLQALLICMIPADAFLCSPSDDHMQRLSTVVEELRHADKVPALG
jgi:hypothetical protein